MLNSIFTILLFQLIGEFFQKFTEISIPGPVIGLILLLSVLLIRAKYFKEHHSVENNLVDFSKIFNLPSATIYTRWCRGCNAFIFIRRKSNFSY